MIRSAGILALIILISSLSTDLGSRHPVGVVSSFSRVFPRLSQGSRLLSRACSRLDYALDPELNICPAPPGLITCSPACPDYDPLSVRVGPRSIPPVGLGLRYHQARIRHTLVSLVFMDLAVA